MLPSCFLLKRTHIRNPSNQTKHTYQTQTCPTLSASPTPTRSALPSSPTPRRVPSSLPPTLSNLQETALLALLSQVRPVLTRLSLDSKTDIVPEGEKSTTQKASDTVSGSGKDAGKEGQSYLDSAKEAIGMGDSELP